MSLHLSGKHKYNGSAEETCKGTANSLREFSNSFSWTSKTEALFWKNGIWNVSECLMSRSLGVQLSGFAVVMHHFHCNMWAAHCRHPLPLVTPSWEIPQSNWATQLPANKGSKKASRMCIFSRSWGFKNIFYRRPHLNVYVLHNASRPQTVYKKRT